MSADDLKDGLIRTRRLVTFASIVLILITIAEIEVAEYTLPWVKGTVKKPEVIYLGLWVALVYWTVSYFQFFRRTLATKDSRKWVQEATYDQLRKRLLADHSDLVDEKREIHSSSTTDGCNIEVNFFGEGPRVAVFRLQPFKYTNETKTSRKTYDWIEFHTVELDTASVRYAKFRAVIGETIASPILWVYMPFVLAGIAAACGIYELVTYSGFISR